MDRDHLKKLDDILNEIVETKAFPGSMIMVLQDGKEMYFGAAGYRDLENKTLITRDTIFRLYSMTKPITAVAAWMLIEDGIISLEDEVGKYIPTYKNQTVADGWIINPVRRNMRIKDLLNMTSGLTYNGILNITEHKTDELVKEGIERMDSENEMSTLELASRLGEIPLVFSPGEGYNYGFSADVMGAVIEVVSGMKFGEFLKKRLFEPLGMEDTGFYVEDSKRDRLAKVYQKTEEGYKEFHYNNLLINLKGEHAPAFESGGAGIFTTLDDYAKFATMLHKGGKHEGKRIIGQETIKFMIGMSMEDMPRESLRKQNGQDGFEYCNLMRIMKDPSYANTIAVEGEYGWDGWLGPCFINDPVNKISILSMLQVTDAGFPPYMKRARNVIYSSL
ncbi:MAG: beta-lactamase family protein [Eubacterium sp.]|nr:beta-lactamase family protein [Eubacterium sp.]